MGYVESRDNVDDQIGDPEFFDTGIQVSVDTAPQPKMIRDQVPTVGAHDTTAQHEHQNSTTTMNNRTNNQSCTLSHLGPTGSTHHQQGYLRKTALGGSTV